MRLVRGSEVSSFLRCRKQWKYAWIDNLEPKRPDNKLFFGTLAHKYLEVYYNNLFLGTEAAEKAGWVSMHTLFHQTDTSGMQQHEIDELWELASGVMENYVKQWGVVDKRWTILATELRFAIPLDSETVYEGTIDLVYLDENGLLKFSDYKNVSSIERYTNMAEMDRQISRYWWALEQLARGNGYIWTHDEQWWPANDVNWSRPGHLSTKLPEPSGFVYNLILKEVPKVPKLLKPTKNVPVALSKAKDQVTTYAVYWQAMIDNGLVSFDNEYDMPNFDPEYNEILKHLSAQESPQGNRFFRRVPVTRNENECQAAMHEFLAVAQDIEYVKPRASELTYRNINADCSWCNYRALCVAELDGSNADLIKNLAYKQKEIKDNGQLFR